jgi:gas vesicle protein
MHNGHHNEGASETGWFGFIAGAMVGAGVALLLASQRGAELRGMVSDYANRAKDDVLEKAEEVYAKGEEVVRDAGRSAREFVKEGQEAAKDAGGAAKELATHAQEMARDSTRSAL